MTKAVIVHDMEKDIADIPFSRVDLIHASKRVSFVKTGAAQEFQHILPIF